MRIYNIYIISLTLIFALTTILLSITAQDLELYFTLYLIECLAVTLVFAQLNVKARKGLNRVGYMLFTGFLCLLTIKVVEIITGTKIL
jgi:hypothetical protein